MAVSRNGNVKDTLQYMLTSGVVSSNYESIIWEELTGEESVSTINILNTAIDENQNIYMLCSKNYEQAKNELCLSSEVEAEIASVINQGKIVLLHDKELTIGDWSGYGYIITDPDTGSAAYMISGGLNGGSSSSLVTISYLVEMGFILYDCFQLYKTVLSVVSLFATGGIVGGIILSVVTLAMAVFTFYNFYHTIDLMGRYINGDEEAGQELETNMWLDIGFAIGSKVLSTTAKNISKTATKNTVTKVLGEEIAEKLIKNSDNPAALSSAIKKLSKSGFSDDTIKFIAESSGEKGLLWAKRQAKNGIKNEIIEQIARNANDCTKYTDDLVKRLSLSNGYADDIIKCVNQYGDDAIKAVEKSGDNAIYIYKTYGENGLKAVANSGDDAIKLINKYGTGDVVEVIAKHGDDAVDIINTYSVDGISALKNGIEPQTINSLVTRNGKIT